MTDADSVYSSQYQRDFGEVMERDIELSECIIHERTISQSPDSSGPLFVMVNGVPVTSLIYLDLADELVKRLDARVILVDLPGTGKSYLRDGYYSWTKQRECLREYLGGQDPHILVVHDISGPIALPLVSDLAVIDRLVVMNTIIKPSEFSPPFPMNWLRSYFFISKPMAYLMPFFIYESKFRDMGIARNDKVPTEQIEAIYDELCYNYGKGRLVEVMNGFELTHEIDQAIKKGIARDIPQLFIWGEMDPALGQERYNLPPLTKNQKMVLIPEAKHFLMLDFQYEIADAIVEWHN
jgi:pimeloyl-ACP methyl ester carboxylesterase